MIWACGRQNTEMASRLPTDTIHCSWVRWASSSQLNHQEVRDGGFRDSEVRDSEVRGQRWQVQRFRLERPKGESHMVGNGRRVLGAEIRHQSVACRKKTGTSVHEHKALNSTNTLSEIGRAPEPQMGPKPADTLILPHETLSKELGTWCPNSQTHGNWDEASVLL